ncbi:MAG: hypothetical protein ABIO40_02445 [Devosia sp.]
MAGSVEVAIAASEEAASDELAAGAALEDELAELDDAAGGALLLQAASVKPISNASGTPASSFMRMMGCPLGSQCLLLLSPSPGESDGSDTPETAFLP